MGIPAMLRKYRVETVPFTNRSHLVLRSRRGVRTVTELQFARFKKQHAARILPIDNEDSVRVNRILSKIVGAIRPQRWAVGLDWEAVLLRHNLVRAMCFAGAGKIVVHTGLLDRFDTDEEIAFVLAHEVGHVIGRHSAEMIRILASQKWFPAFLLRPLFRRQEVEADYIGMIVLAASGFDPHVAPRALDKFGKMQRENMYDKILYFLSLSTHPSPTERSQFLSRPKIMEEAMELYRKVTSAGLCFKMD